MVENWRTVGWRQDETYVYHSARNATSFHNPFRTKTQESCLVSWRKNWVTDLMQNLTFWNKARSKPRRDSCDAINFRSKFWAINSSWCNTLDISWSRSILTRDINDQPSLCQVWWGSGSLPLILSLLSKPRVIWFFGFWGVSGLLLTRPLNKVPWPCHLAGVQIWVFSEFPRPDYLAFFFPYIHLSCEFFSLRFATTSKLGDSSLFTALEYPGGRHSSLLRWPKCINASLALLR